MDQAESRVSGQAGEGGVDGLGVAEPPSGLDGDEAGQRDPYRDGAPAAIAAAEAAGRS